MSEVAAGGDHTWVFEAIGTRWVLTTAHALSQTQRLRVARLIEDYDRTFSRFREDSVVTRMSHAAPSSCLSVPGHCWRPTGGLMS